MGQLAPFFEKFPLAARMYYAGRLCGSTDDHDRPLVGHLHVLKKGRLTIIQPNGRQIVIDTPSIVFFPRPHQHRLHASEEEGTELVCATIEFGAGMLNPIASLPEPLVVPVDALPELTPTLQLLFSEAFSELPGPSSCHRPIVRICPGASDSIRNACPAGGQRSAAGAQ
jgi:hypothetical protein